MDLSVFASPVTTETVWRDLRKIRGRFRSKGIRWTVSSWGLERPSRPATWHVRGAVTLILYKRDTVIELGQPHQREKKERKEREREGKGRMFDLRRDRGETDKLSAPETMAIHEKRQ